jgi:pimeloyl-ACP methyl ester carboxylesterase
VRCDPLTATDPLGLFTVLFGGFAGELASFPIIEEILKYLPPTEPAMEAGPSEVARALQAFLSSKDCCAYVVGYSLGAGSAHQLAWDFRLYHADTYRTVRSVVMLDFNAPTRKQWLGAEDKLPVLPQIVKSALLISSTVDGVLMNRMGLDVNLAYVDGPQAKLTYAGTHFDMGLDLVKDISGEPNRLVSTVVLTWLKTQREKCTSWGGAT